MLPADLPAPPIYAKVNPADAPVLTLAISSESMPLTDVQNLANTRLAQKISQVSGVGLVSLSGGQRPAVRIQANPQALASFGIGLTPCVPPSPTPIRTRAKGSFDGPKRAFTINSNDQLRQRTTTATSSSAYKNGAPVRLRDVANMSRARKTSAPRTADPRLGGLGRRAARRVAV